LETSHIVNNCFCQCGYGHEHKIEANPDSSTEEKDDDLHKEWIQLGAEKKVNISSYVSTGNELAMCEVPLV
jgi:hypothetical protein